MKTSNKGIKRREVIKGLGAMSLVGLVGLGSSSELLGQIVSTNDKPLIPSDGEGKKIRLGIIGFGIRGQDLVRASGFATTKWKEKVIKAGKSNKKDTRYQDFLNAVPLNIEYRGVCDLFDVRADLALQTLGKKAKRYKNYKDLLNSDDIDAVIIAVPDHWHAQMTLDAVKAGKHVYVEKCFTRTEEETQKVYDAVKNSDCVFQLGHQLRHNESYHAAKDAIDKGLLGKISLIQTNTNRNSTNGAWVYNIPPEGNEDTIDWNQFNLPGVNMDFDKDRFFRWRKYWDYGTGLCGDLMTHDFDAINQILGVGIPETVMASGGNYYWKDGREVPDVLQVAMEYPSKGFTYLYSATQASERLRRNLIMGDDATMEIGASMNIYPDANSKRYKTKLEQGVMNTETPFYSSKKTNEVDAVSSATTKYFANKGMMGTYKNGVRYDTTYLHIEDWLNVIRYGGETSCNIDQAYEEAIATHMTVKSYKEKRQVSWDSNLKKIV